MTAYALCRRLESSDSFPLRRKGEYAGPARVRKIFVDVGSGQAVCQRSCRAQSAFKVEPDVLQLAVGAVSKTGRIVSLRGVTVSTADANSLPLMSFAEKVYCPAVGRYLALMSAARRAHLPPDRRRFRLPASTRTGTVPSASKRQICAVFHRCAERIAFFGQQTDGTEWYSFPSVSLPSAAYYRCFRSWRPRSRHPRSQPRGWCIRPGWELSIP